MSAPKPRPPGRLEGFAAIWRKDFLYAFVSPVAYVVLVSGLALTGAVFLQMLEGHLGGPETPPSLLFRTLAFLWLPIVAVLTTMRLFAEEIHSGTIEPLLTAPVTDAAVVLGKYAAGLAFIFAATLPALAFPYIVAALAPGLERPDTGTMLAGLLGLGLLAMFCTAIGLVVSLLTRNQIVAAVLGLCAILAPLLAAPLLRWLPGVPAAIPEALAAHEHIMAFGRGVIDTRPIALYGALTAWLLFLAVQLLEGRRLH